MNKSNRRSSMQIMLSLIGLVKPMLHIMILAITLGTLGYLCAISLTILASHILLGMLGKIGFAFLLGVAVLRGILHYAEQYCNHYIAFKILAIIRHKVFAVLRKLCPAKLEGKEKGNLIAIITSDIELLEVFYAHTISPIAIAVLTSGIMVLYISHIHPAAGFLALVAYCVVGIAIPVMNGKCGAADGLEVRNKIGELNSNVLDSLRGIDELIQYEQGTKYIARMNDKSTKLGNMQKKLSKLEGQTKGRTNLIILLSSIAMLVLSSILFQYGAMEFQNVVIATVTLMGSFGPVVALANLSNNLNQTLASGERVLSLLEEQPMVKEVPEDTCWKAVNAEFGGANADDITFAYNQEVILKNYNIEIQPGKIIGIHGKSGSGKSTLLKLFMRFWDVNSGKIHLSGENIKEIPTCKLRNMESYVTQETALFHDSIYKNIAIAKENTTMEEVVEAAKKASIHDFIMTLPKQYETEVGELGDTLSGGEKQRIGIARAFLHDAPFMLLDEPTSNLDSLNEGIILKSLQEESNGKTVVLVSHRESTMKVTDSVFEMENGRVS